MSFSVKSLDNLIIIFWLSIFGFSQTASAQNNIRPSGFFNQHSFSNSSGINLLKSDSTKHKSSFEAALNFNLSGGLSASEKSYLSGLGFGAINTNYKRGRVKINLNYEATQANLGDYFYDFVDSTGVISSFGVAKDNSVGFFGHRPTGRINLGLSKHFSIETGYDVNFWGHGYRSMVLGENAAPSPFLKFLTSVWKIDYQNLFLQLRDFNENNDINNTRLKYMAMHAIDFKITDKWSLSVFETVVWQNSDSLSTRNFELNYLNPIIFYRPVEFAQGSADNVLLGLAFNYQHNKKFNIYGQLFLDEFLLSEVRGATGWWANKVGVQVGFKAENVIPNSLFYSEFNTARPFTYTHGSVFQNYGHLNQSLAHPLGTNFYEWTSGFQIEKADWKFNTRFNWALYGRDKNGDNYGGDIFRSYAGPFRSRGNIIGQGNTHNSYIFQSRLAKPIINGQLWLSLSHTWRHVSSEFELENEHLFQLGLSSYFSGLLDRRSQGKHHTLVPDF